MEPIAIAETVQEPPDTPLRARISAANEGHSLGSLFGRKYVGHRLHLIHKEVAATLYKS